MSPFDTTTDSPTPRLDVTGTSPVLPEGAVLAASVVRPTEEPNLGAQVSVTASESQPPGIKTPGISAQRLASFRAALQQDKQQPQIQVIERWQGVVTKIESDSFTARLVSVGGVAALPEEEGTFPLELVSPDDHDLVQEGAFFNYTIGRETRGGTRRSVSILAFRRMPMWHLRQIHEATIRADRKAALLGKRSGDSERSTVAAAGD